MTLQLTTLESLRATIANWRKAGETVALVPTMGALHRGHLALVEEGKRRANRVITSIFVNPTQFGPNEDFSRYPRTLDADIAALHSVDNDAVWLPDVATMYPDGFATTIHVSGITEPLEGQFRPGHFDGVATVVAKLLNQVTPDIALFGEKDYQQLALIKRLSNDLCINTSVIGVPTIREDDGLALSSRNRYLSPEERKTAIELSKTMRATITAIRSGEPIAAMLEQGRQHLLKNGFTKIDYFDLRHAETLVPLSTYQPPARLLAAAWLGTTRLIDNMEA